MAYLRSILFFSLALASLEAQAATAPLAMSTVAGPVSLSPQNITLLKNAALITQSNFKQWFNVDVKGGVNTPEASRALIESEFKMAQQQLQAYYAKLRLCTAGSYNYPIPNPRASIMPNQGFYFMASSTIAGMEAGKCKVTNTILDQADQICLYPSADSALFTDAQALEDLKNPMTVDRSIMLKMTKEDCTVVDPKQAKEAYLKALASCTPGTYKYPSPKDTSPMAMIKGQSLNESDLVTVVSVISGSKDDHCLVDTTGPHRPSMHCEYSKDSIDYLIQKQNTPPSTNTPGQNSAADISSEDIDASVNLLQECKAK